MARRERAAAFAAEAERERKRWKVTKWFSQKKKVGGAAGAAGAAGDADDEAEGSGGGAQRKRELYARLVGGNAAHAERARSGAYAHMEPAHVAEGRLPGPPSPMRAGGALVDAVAYVPKPERKFLAAHVAAVEVGAEGKKKSTTRLKIEVLT